MRKTHRSQLVLFLSLLLAAVLFAACLKQNGQSSGENSGSEEQTVAASADGVTVRADEFRATYRRLAEYYQQMYAAQGLTMDAETQKEIREGSARQVLLQKIYIKEAEALGLSLTEEEREICRQAAQMQVDAITEQYRAYMNANGGGSEADLEVQLGAYYQKLGIQRDDFLAFTQMTEESELYRQKMDAYYLEQDTPDEETLLRYYRESVEASMYTVDENGEKTSAYTNGLFWNYMKKYRDGHYSPLLYVPDGFIYIDFILVQTASQDEAEEIARKVTEGETPFDELMNSKDNADPFRGMLDGPYPIGETDHAQLFKPQAVYTRAAALGIGEIGSYVAQPVTDDDGNTTVDVYLFRRAEGWLCIDGDSGVINIDCFPETRSLAVENYRIDRRYERQEEWLADVSYGQIVYED